MAYKMLRSVFFLAIAIGGSALAQAQTESASLTGSVKDSSNAVIVNAEVRLQSIERGTATITRTNTEGVYVFPSVRPGQYRLSIKKEGFQTVDVLGITANVQDHLQENIQMSVGSAEQSVTVTASSPLLNTQDASVSTVVDRNFAEHLPLNGRSFQSLIYQTPGVVATPGTTTGDGGQFSVNGQRASANYWMVDGVGANAASATGAGGDSQAGAVGATSVFGGTNSLVSIDALQEFRIQTSTFAPEFGRTPGAQISIVTRSGTNQFHGTAFDYLRNDVLDASNWFNGFENTPPLPKAKERQNDFGGTLGGPILRDRTFFFFSYEGLRLRLPRTLLTQVPCDASCTGFGDARSTAVPAMQPFLNAYPVPNGSEVFNPCTPGSAGCPASGELPTGGARFNESFSNPASLDAIALRVDHRISDKLNMFGRYDYAPSSIRQRGIIGTALNVIDESKNTIQTVTLGLNWLFSSSTTNEFRFNYSRVPASSRFVMDTFGGGKPITEADAQFASGLTFENADVFVSPLQLSGGALKSGIVASNVQHQYNLVDNVTKQISSHTIRLGVDYRRLSPSQDFGKYLEDGFFSGVPSFQKGNLLFSFGLSNVPATILYRNLGLFAQDAWRLRPTVTLTYGLRWDNDFSPTAFSGPPFPALTGFNRADLSTTAVGPAGAASFHNTYTNVAPRVGIAYQATSSSRWTTILRAGAGIFYDLASSQGANLILQGGYPYTGSSFVAGGTFPLTGAAAMPPPITPPSQQSPGAYAAYDENVKLPYSAQWSLAVEQQLGSDQQTITATYIGSIGRRLLQYAVIANPNPTFTTLGVVFNGATSDYHALDLQYQKRLSRGFQMLGSFVLSHSIDSASSGNIGASSPTDLLDLNNNRGPSDFDIRVSGSVAATYQIPGYGNGVMHTITSGWSLQNTLLTHSAPPVSVTDIRVFSNSGASPPAFRPDVLAGIPVYLYGSQYPGGKAINYVTGAATCPDGTPSIGAFCDPPLDATGNPARQGNLPRNALRGFDVFQWDLALHREFTLHENVKLQFRAEFFNILNHPNFGSPDALMGTSTFGRSQRLLSDSLAVAGIGNGAFNPLYQIGGPRSIQLALKLSF